MPESALANAMTSPDAQSLNKAAMQAMAARDFAAARGLLEQARAQDPANLSVLLNLAGLLRVSNEVEAAQSALADVLKLDPRNFPALLMKASLLEREGKVKQAAIAYGDALTQAPPDERLDPATLRAVEHAREVNGRHAAELAEHLHSAVGIGDGSAASKRAVFFADLLLGRRKHYRQQPAEIFYPGLPTIELYEREEFDWLPEFEAFTPHILAELAEVLRASSGSLTPYIKYPEGLPIDQWSELNHNPDWSAFHLYEYGRRIEENCRQCPKTMEAISLLPQPHIPNRSPAAMFSVLKPHTHIPPHTGVANTRLVVHLPLVVPPDCGFRVGNETREWRPGEAWVFDDTIEHEAWNESEQVRVILICDIWSPRLSETDRALITEIITAMDRFNEVTPQGGI